MVGNRRQRQRAHWLEGNWTWITELAQDFGIEGNFDKSPSQSTLSRFFSKADERALKELYLNELRDREMGIFNKNPETLPPVAANQLIQYCIDGKSRRGCVSESTGRTEIDVTFLRADTRTVTFLEVCPDKEGEAVTAKKMMSMHGHQIPPAVFTTDAGITSPEFTRVTTEKGHEYIVAIKGNAGKIFNEICETDWSRSVSRAVVQDKKTHGRYETRTIEILPSTAFSSQGLSKYSKCACVLSVTRTFKEKGKVTTENRYFIASEGLSSLTPAEFLERVRAHWTIENGLHWCKDVVLGEDDLPKQSHNSSRILGFLKSIVISLGFSIYKSVQKFVDTCAGKPRQCILKLFFPD